MRKTDGKLDTHIPNVATEDATNRIRANSNKQPLPTSLSDVYHGDARLLSAALSPESINVTITSPPYFDAKDYGARGQIGFGQDYATYLDDLQTVFGHVLRATAQDGSLWIVIDTLRRDQEVLPLPFDLVARLKDVGWVLRDVIIWKKERTVPWVHAGATRRIFEYILVLAKSKNSFKYFVDKERDISDLKSWWVRYPERYNPRGKALEEIWSYDIPTQGSWGRRYIRHFCPLPSGLVSRVINLTTNPGDVVLDPFAGSGAVLVAAHSVQRQYVGFELNSKYIAMFRKYLREEPAPASDESRSKGRLSGPEFETLIKQLRTLKYARLLYRSVVKRFGAKTANHILTRPLRTKSREPNKICSAEFVVLLTKSSKQKKVEEHLASISTVRPLSKFGVDATIRVITSTRVLPKAYRRRSLYSYSATNSHSFAAQTNLTASLAGKHPIISVIRAKVGIPDD